MILSVLPSAITRPSARTGSGATQGTDVEVLADEKQATNVGFLLRAMDWFDAQGITCRRVLSDQGSAYRSKPWREACWALGLTAKRTKPYTHLERQGSASHRCTSMPPTPRSQATSLVCRK